MYFHCYLVAASYYWNNFYCSPHLFLTSRHLFCLWCWLTFLNLFIWSMKLTLIWICSFKVSVITLFFFPIRVKLFTVFLALKLTLIWICSYCSLFTVFNVITLSFLFSFSFFFLLICVSIDIAKRLNNLWEKNWRHILKAWHCWP